jgi:GAF domain-containing protein
MFDYLPPAIADILNRSKTPEALFTALMPALGLYLDCDRCFLYVRYPTTCLGKVPFCWIRNDDIPMIEDEGWKLEPSNLSERDPMFAAALRTEPSIVVEDVETASPDILDKQFERESFGHRALIHAHICHAGELWGVLQPCIFDRSRQWKQVEQSAIAQIAQAITPSAIAYVMGSIKVI